MDKIDEMRKKLISAAKRKVQEKYEEKDVHIIKSVNLLGDLDSVSNLLTEQLREWYSIHFPELNGLVPEQKEYLRLCHYIGDRSSFTVQKVLEHLANKEDSALADKIVSAADSSMGSGASEQDLDEMRSLALNCLNILEEREAISKYIEQAMEKELPNFSAIAGATIGAKILAKIGSKQRLAFVPASTLQIVGAEKALFLHIKMGVKGPKFGYLYQHPLVKAASYENKGRMARTIAAKLSIAAKMDYFGSEANSDVMKKQLEERAKELSERKRKEKPVRKEEPMQKTPTREQPREFRKGFSSERPRPEFRKFGQEHREGFSDRPRFGGKPHFGSNRHFGGNRREGGRPFGRGRIHEDRHERQGGRPWKVGKQKRDYHSTERKAFEHESRRQERGSFRHGNREDKPHTHSRPQGHGKLRPKGRNRGDLARKRF